MVLVNWFNKNAPVLSTMQMGGALGGVMVPIVALALDLGLASDVCLGVAVMAICRR